MVTRWQAVVVIALAVLALATVAVAAATHSALPLFFGWLPQLLIIVYMSRSDRKLAAATESAPEVLVASPPGRGGGGMPRLGNVRRMARIARQMDELRESHPQAWAAGEELADEALRTRSPDLVLMLRDGPEDQVDDYIRRMTEGATSTFQGAVAGGEVQVGEPLTEAVLVAFGISMGTALRDQLDRERAGRTSEGSAPPSSPPEAAAPPADHGD